MNFEKVLSSFVRNSNRKDKDGDGILSDDEEDTGTTDPEMKILELDRNNKRNMK
jgi:hypothetical protein